MESSFWLMESTLRSKLIRVFFLPELAREVLHFLLGAFAGIAVAFLQQTDQFLRAATDAIKLVVGQFAPLLLDLAAYLFPLAFENVLIDFDVHVELLLDHSMFRPCQRRAPEKHFSTYITSKPGYVL